MDETTQEEMYARASVTKKLEGHAEMVIASAAFVGRRLDVAPMTWRLVDAMDAKEHKFVVQRFADMVLKQASRERKQISQEDAVNVAKLFAGYITCPICPTCQGRGATLLGDPHGGRGVLSDVACRQCGGTGRRSLKREARELGETLADLTLWLNGEVLSLTIMAEQAMRRKRIGK